MKILVLDPGERVGWVAATVDPDHVTPVFPGEHRDGDDIIAVPALTVDSHGITTAKTMALATYKAVVTENKYDLVIYESWRLAAGMAKRKIGSEFPEIQFIGAVRLCCWINPRVQVLAQPPSAMKTAEKIVPRLYTDIADRIAKAPKSHDESHDVSALLHLAKWHWDTYVKPATGGAHA